MLRSRLCGYRGVKGFNQVENYASNSKDHYQKPTTKESSALRHSRLIKVTSLRQAHSMGEMTVGWYSSVGGIEFPDAFGPHHHRRRHHPPLSLMGHVLAVAESNTFGPNVQRPAVTAFERFQLPHTKSNSKNPPSVQQKALLQSTRRIDFNSFN